LNQEEIQKARAKKRGPKYSNIPPYGVILFASQFIIVEKPPKRERGSNLLVAKRKMNKMGLQSNLICLRVVLIPFFFF
jgi:hypothetical protein